MKTMIMILIMNSLIFLMLKHPLSMGFNLIINITIISLMMNMMMKSSWYSYILFLVMLGGMLILFMYMASIASNEKMKFSQKILILILIMIMIMINLNINMEFFMMDLMLLKYSQVVPMTKMFLNKSLYMTIFISIYLLITMIVSIFIINIYEGPMRKKS